MPPLLHAPSHWRVMWICMRLWRRRGGGRGTVTLYAIGEGSSVNSMQADLTVSLAGTFFYWISKATTPLTLYELNGITVRAGTEVTRGKAIPLSKSSSQNVSTPSQRLSWNPFKQCYEIDNANQLTKKSTTKAQNSTWVVWGFEDGEEGEEVWCYTQLFKQRRVFYLFLLTWRLRCGTERRGLDGHLKLPRRTPRWRNSS